MQTAGANQLELEVSATHQRPGFRTIGAPGSHRLDWSLVPMNACDRFLDVQLSGLSFGIAPIPIEKPKSCVAGLLHFGHQYAAANRVDGAGRQEHAVARLGL